MSALQPRFALFSIQGERHRQACVCGLEDVLDGMLHKKVPIDALRWGWSCLLGSQIQDVASFRHA
eukprot:1710221-Amphidinium_carterae.1